MSAPVVTVCRKTSFSAGHRYFNSGMTEEENRELYGSSYSSSGHGHNFVLEAYIEGEVDPQTGMVVNLKDIDADLKAVTKPLDHHFLNTDVAYFRDNVPTTENLAHYCFVEMSTRVASRGLLLKKVRLYEGNDLWVDCEVS